MEEPSPGPGGARMPRSLQLCCSTAGFTVPKPRSSLRVDPILFFIAWYIRGESAAAGWKRCTWGSGRIWGREGFRKQGAAGDIPSACSDPPRCWCCGESRRLQSRARLWGCRVGGVGGTGLRSGAGTAHPSSISPQGPPGGGGPPGTPIMPSPAGRSPKPVPKASPASPGRVFGGARCHSCRGGAAAQAAAAPSPSAF